MAVYTQDSGANQPQTKHKPMAMYTKGSGADQPQTKRIKRRQLTMAVYNRIVAQTNRRPSANQWQCTQMTKDSGADQPQTKRRQWQCRQRMVEDSLLVRLRLLLRLLLLLLLPLLMSSWRSSDQHLSSLEQKLNGLQFT